MRPLCSWLLLFLVTVTAMPGWSDDSISCDFEDGDCVWESLETEKLQWKKKRHNSNSYMLLDMSDAVVNEVGKLATPWLEGSSGQTCQLQFGLTRTSIGCVMRLSVYLLTQAKTTELWNATGKKTFARMSPKIDVPCANPRHQIVFEGSRMSGGGGLCKIGLDDVRYEKQPDPTTTEGGKTRKKKVSKISCDFKYGTCGWKKKAGTEVLRWKKSPLILNPFDYFMSAEMVNAAVDQTATMTSPWLRGSPNQRCHLQFGYIMHSASSSLQLSVLRKKGKTLTELWKTARTNLSEAELTPEIDVPCTHGRYQILIRAKKITGEPGTRIGIDDIQYKQHDMATAEDGKTLQRSDAEMSCDFKYDDCAWTTDRTEKLQWQRYSLFVFDNTMSVDFDKAGIYEAGILSTPWLKGSAHQSCQLQFDFRFFEDPYNLTSQQLSVFFKTETEVTVLWSTTGGQQAKPESSPLLDVPCSEPRYQLALQGKKLRRSAGHIIVYFIDYTQRNVTTTTTTTTTVAATTTETIEPPPKVAGTEDITLKTVNGVADVPEDVGTNATEVRNVTPMTDVAEAAIVTNATDSGQPSRVTAGFTLAVVVVAAVAAGGAGVGFTC